MKTVVIIASARKYGMTHKVVDELVRDSNWDIIDLLDYNITHFDYEHHNIDDDFLDLITLIINTYDVLVLATPVYWYAMSGRMKVFFDRITDLLNIQKDTGRLLRGKYMAVITSSNGNNLNNNFWLPFKMSADYLGMQYIDGLHTYHGTVDKLEIQSFQQKINSYVLST